MARTIDLEQVSFEKTLAVGIGRDADTGERLAFYGDHRMMSHLMDGLRDKSPEDQLLVRVEEWQLAGRDHPNVTD